MLIALDNDGTFTAMPEVWTKFVEHARSTGAEVICISSRFPQVPISGFPGKVYYTCGQQKWEWADEHGIKVDIWIDDMPCCIGGPPGLEPGQAKQRRELIRQIFVQNGLD